MAHFWQALPPFGPYRKEQSLLTSERKLNEDLLDEKYQPGPHRPARQPIQPVPRVKVCRLRHDDVIGHLLQLQSLVISESCRLKLICCFCFVHAVCRSSQFCDVCVLVIRICWSSWNWRLYNFRPICALFSGRREKYLRSNWGNWISRPKYVEK